MESAHNGINKMKHRYSNVKNDLNRLEYIMNQHPYQPTQKFRSFNQEKNKKLKKK